MVDQALDIQILKDVTQKKVKSAMRREATEYLEKSYSAGQRRISGLLQMARSKLYHKLSMREALKATIFAGGGSGM